MSERVDWHEFEQTQEAERANETSTTNQMGTQQLVDYGQELEQLTQVVDNLEAELKELKTRRDLLAKELIPDMMKRLGLASETGKGSFTLSSGAKVSLRNDMFAGCKKEDEDSLFQWLRDNGLGDIIKPVVNHQTLKATCREQLENGRAVPPMVNVYHETKAVLTRAKKS